ncbi:MAG: GAF domain-containing protein [Anaerolineae bacterium]|nr:GAF domain-containing protein [Anaerolineae bacterium]
MLARIRSWLAPPKFENDEEGSNAAAVLNAMLLMVFGALLFYLIVALFARSTVEPFVFVVVLFLMATCAGSFVLLRQKHVRPAAIVMTLVFWAAFTVAALIFGGMHDEAVLGYFVVIVLAGVLLGHYGLAAFTALSALSIVGLYAAEYMDLITPQLDFPSTASDLVLIVLLITMGAVLVGYNVQRLSRLYRVARQSAMALEESNAELEVSRDVLAQQARQLERRAHYLEATAAVARDTTLELDIRELLPRLVRLVSAQLGFYHAGIFFLEPNGEWLALQAASSEGGQRMLAQGHRLRVGQGVVGDAAERRRYRVMMDVRQQGAAEATYFDNPDLPETRSEAALPLLARGELIGVLDVQSTEPNAFDDEDLIALQAMANQLAVALSNARLYWEAQQALEAERGAYGELSRQAWQELLRVQPELAIVRSQEGILPISTPPDQEVREALKTGHSVVGARPAAQRTALRQDSGEGGQSPGLAVPIRVRGQVIGAIDAHKPAGSGAWTPEQIVLLETLCEQLGDALDDARMYRDAQRRAAREQTLSAVTGRVRESLDVNVVLQRAVQEMRQALGVAEVEVRLEPFGHLPAGRGQSDEEVRRGV